MEFLYRDKLQSYLHKHLARHIVLVLAMITNSAISAQPAPPGFFFRDGDRVQFLGDSITESRMYSTLVESYLLTRFPNWKITFRNTGWGSDMMNLRMRNGLEKGYARDIAPLQSTVVTVNFGMNDALGETAGLAGYADSARALTGKLAAAGVRAVLVSPSPRESYEAGQPAGSAHNTMLRQYADVLKTVSTEKRVPFVDLFNPLVANIEAGRAAGVLSPTDGGPRLIPDTVHPNWAGHLLIATHMLKTLGAPAQVSSVEINAATGQAVAKAARLENVKIEHGLSFTRTDDALPWPITRGAALALKLPNVTPFGDLSRYDLKISGLPAAKYDVAIDGVVVGTWERAQLEKGINFSEVMSGPISDQAQTLLEKIMEKNTAFHARWRGVQIYDFPAWVKTDIEPDRAVELKRLDNEISALENQITALRQPKPHIWTLTPVL